MKHIVMTRVTIDPDTLTITDRYLVLVPIRRYFSRNAPCPAVHTFTNRANDRAHAALRAAINRD